MTSRRRRASGISVLIWSLALAGLFVFHRFLPGFGGVLSMVETVFPWLGIVVLALVVSAVILRTGPAAIGAVVVALAWGFVVLPAAIPVPAVTGDDTISIVSENLEAGNGDAAGIVARLADRDPDVIVLQELSADIRDQVSDALAERYPHDYLVGTVGVWSRTPLSNGERLDLGLGWTRALSVDVETPLGATRIFAVHLSSFRPGEHEDRDTMLGNLASTLAADESERLVVVGDFNTATDDHVLAPVLDQARLVRSDAVGFPFTWSSSIPVVALDHALVRGIDAASLHVLDGNGSDHRAIAVTVGR
ncbi:MAG: endonuclease/exonuclease/phosphatase family protein [Leifsonia sp.]